MDSSFSARIKQRQLAALRERGSGRFASFVFPIIRNVLAHRDIIQDLVAVQPMNAPAGQVFYLDYVMGPVERQARELEPRLEATIQEAAMKTLCGVLAKVVDLRPAVNENEPREPEAPPARQLETRQIFGVTVQSPPARPKITAA